MADRTISAAGSGPNGENSMIPIVRWTALVLFAALVGLAVAAAAVYAASASWSRPYAERGPIQGSATSSGLSGTAGSAESAAQATPSAPPFSGSLGSGPSLFGLPWASGRGGGA